MYLTRRTVMAVLKDIGSVDRFTIALDYMSEEVVAGTTGDSPPPNSSGASPPWAHRGASASTTLARLPPRQGSGDGCGVACELHRAHWPHWPVDLVIDGHYFLCTLNKGA